MYKCGMKEVLTMTRIRDVVQEALATGYLTLEAENQLRQLLAKRYDKEDLNAFMKLQEAAMGGKVKQQSRENAVEATLPAK
jgi:flagellar biosynthesis protein FliP